MSEKGNIFDVYCKFLSEHMDKYGPRTIVLMQVGMFHELYGVDNDREKIGFVREISEVLNIQMTRRDKKVIENTRKNFLMAGFPSISLERYVNILIEENYTVVVVDQVTEAPNVTRAVTKIYSPGTYINECRSSENNYLVSIYFQGEMNGKSGLLAVGLSSVDLSTGESCVYEAWSSIEDPNYALDETYRFLQTHRPKEIVLYAKDIDEIFDFQNINELLDLQDFVTHHRLKVPEDYRKVVYQNQFFQKVFHADAFGLLSPIEWLDLETKPISVLAFMTVLQFAWEHNENIVRKLKKPEIWEQQDHCILANNAINQLSLIPSGSHTSKFHSVFGIIDKTSTAIGKRLLKHRLLNPIMDPVKIKARYDLISSMRTKITMPDDSVDYKYKLYQKSLTNMVDIQRFHRRLRLKMLQPCEFNTLATTYDKITEVLTYINHSEFGLPLADLESQFADFQQYYANILDLEETAKFTLAGVTDSFFQLNYHPKLDEISYQIKHYNQVLQVLLQEFSEVLGPECVSLKFSEVSGYYLTLTQKRFQTFKEKWGAKWGDGGHSIAIDGIEYVLQLANDLTMEPVSKKSTSCNVFSPLLKEVSAKLKPLHQEIRELTTEVYYEFLSEFDQKWTQLLEQIESLIAEIDVAKSGAKMSLQYYYHEPEVIATEGKSFLEATDLRHPIIERINQKVAYVPHNIQLGSEMDGMLVYGVNSCGKSSLMKSVGINIILAQAGMYVAAKSFRFGPYQYVLTRIIGNDNIFKGLSSFAVEMTELRGILKRANNRSLVLGDEICHGTETISGVAIVASAIKILATRESSFIFATHLHQLADMEEITTLTNVRNFHLRVFHDATAGNLVYDRNLMPGNGDPIYGLEVAKAMHMDPDFLQEANRIRQKLLKISTEILPIRKSHFNSGIYLDKCQICDADAEETHHIGFQCTADEEQFIGHYHKNIMANLVPLCTRCHRKVHIGDKVSGTKLQIEGYVETSHGLQLQWETIQMTT